MGIGGALPRFGRQRHLRAVARHLHDLINRQIPTGQDDGFVGRGRCNRPVESGRRRLRIQRGKAERRKHAKTSDQRDT